MREEDRLLAGLVEQIMCTHKIDVSPFTEDTAPSEVYFQSLIDGLVQEFPDVVDLEPLGLLIRPGYEASARLLCAYLDSALSAQHTHRLAI